MDEPPLQTSSKYFRGKENPLAIDTPHKIMDIWYLLTNIYKAIYLSVSYFLKKSLSWFNWVTSSTFNTFKVLLEHNTLLICEGHGWCQERKFLGADIGQQIKQKLAIGKIQARHEESQQNV